MDRIDVLVVGAGPAGLTAAIRVRSGRGRRARASVIVIDKAPASGNHNLSGARSSRPASRNWCPAGRRSASLTELVPVERDEMYFLLQRAPTASPLVVPQRMHHTGDVAVSLSRLVAFLVGGRNAGVEVYRGYSARELLVEDGARPGRPPGRGRARPGRPSEGQPPSRPRRSAPG